MKIELVDSHSSTILIVVIWSVVSLFWCWFMGIFDRDLFTICLVLGAFNILPFLLAKQYLFGIHLRLGVDANNIYFPAKSKVIQKIPMKLVNDITFSKIDNKERTDGNEPYFVEMIYVGIDNFSSNVRPNLQPPLWGWFTDTGIAIRYNNREEALVVVSEMNQFKEKISNGGENHT